MANTLLKRIGVIKNSSCSRLETTKLTSLKRAQIIEVIVQINNNKGKLFVTTDKL